MDTSYTGVKFFWALISRRKQRFGPFFAEYPCQLIEEELKAQKTTLWSEKHPKNDFFSKPFLKEPATNQEFPKCASTNFGNSWFVAGPFQEFSIWVSTFWGFLIFAGPFLEKVVFLACFPLPFFILLLQSSIFNQLTLIFCQKIGPKRQFLPEIRAQTFFTPYLQSPPPNMFHDKAKRTQQENLLSSQPIFFNFLFEKQY